MLTTEQYQQMWSLWPLETVLTPDLPAAVRAPPLSLRLWHHLLPPSTASLVHEARAPAKVSF